MKIKQITAELSEKAVQELVADESVSKSKKIIRLFEAGYSVKHIAELLGIRYNFSYNVVSNHININNIPIQRSERGNKKRLILEMFKQGKTLKEISIDTKTNYNYVFKVVKEYKNKELNG